MMTAHRRFQGAAIIVFILLVLQYAQSTSSTHEREQEQRADGRSCMTNEWTALLTFKASLSDPSRRLSSWHGRACCQWRGIQCDNRTGHVIKLDLRNPHPHGMNQDSRLSLLAGEMPSSIVSLKHLRYLDLSYNDFKQARIPLFMGALRSLRYINFSNANFHGEIPSRIGNLSELRCFDISNNDLNTQDLSWLHHLSLLRNLDMSGVDLSSARDWVQWLNMLPALRVVRLSDCRFSGGVEKTVTHSNLTHIEVLDLSRNSFNFSVHHNWFWGLTSLKELHLSNSEWSGPIPDALGNMSSLQVIDLSQNHILSGNIPRNLASLCDLQILNFEEVNINGDIEKLMERLPKCSWNKLRVLNFYRSNLTGEIPVWIGNLSSLVSLDLSVNELVGHVPIGIGALSNLNYLGLGSNKLSGLLSEEHFAGLVNLDTLDLEDNSLRLGLGEDWVPPFQLLTIGFFRSCDLGPQFPAWLRQAPEIVHLDISNTNIIDRLPDWFWVVFRNAISLFLSNNQISGALPAKLEIESASVLDISNNSLSGTLPVYVTGPQLERLYLSDNYITGNIPAYFCELYSLKELDLSNNELTGGFPQCLKNGSSASDPYSFNHFGSMLEVLDLKNNHLSGELLDNLWSATRLVFLDVSFNKLSGSVPAWIGEKLPLLGVFILRSNMFCGHLPKELMKLEYLHYLDLAHNNISGNIPSSLVDLKTMAIPGGLNYFPESISMFTKHQELHYTLKFKGSAVTLVDLSCNSFIGQIPKELSLLKGLQSLNLSGNQLSGPIPDGIGGLRELESLDISYNGLSGEIPSSLSDLTFLSWLNLSYNNLSGQIPSGKQLQTLNNQYMYIGNPGLCGPPLVNNCSTNERGKNSYEEDEGTARDRSSFYISMSLGFVMGLWMVFCTMMFKEKFRDAYFQMIDNIYDKVYLFFFATMTMFIMCNSL